MALPKIAAATFEMIQPSTGEPLHYRQFLVKEEKILLTARESQDKTDIFNAIKQIVNNCVVDEGFDADKIPLFDLEYIFIQLRAKSVDNIVKFQVEDSDDGQIYDLQLDLNEVEVQMPEKEHDGVVKVSDEIGIKLTYPSAKLADKIKKAETMTEVTHEMILNSIEYVFDADNTYPWEKESRQDKVDFIESLPVDAFAEIEEYFNSLPVIEHVVTYENSEGKEKRVVFRNLDDFFTLY